MAKISVAMSAFNTENYIEKAINSILTQTFKDFEFIIVENGSTDSTREIIERYAEKDERIHVIRNEKNASLAMARNQALECATGEYLYIIDSDDWALPDALETMYSMAKQNDAQYVVSGFYMDYYEGGRSLSYIVCPDDAAYTQAEFRKHAIDYLTRMLLTVLWNKLYSISFLREHGIKFRDLKSRGEDLHFNMDILMDVERVCTVDKPLYHYYRSRQGSENRLMYRSHINEMKRRHMAHIMNVYRHWGITDEVTMSKLSDYYIAQLAQCISETIGSQEFSTKEKKEKIKIIVSDEYTRFALKHKSGGSAKITLFSLLLRTKNVSGCYMAGSMMKWFQILFPVAFTSMRTQIAQKTHLVEVSK